MSIETSRKRYIDLMAAMDHAQTYLELMQERPCEEYARRLRDAANTIYACEMADREEAEADALAKEMSPQPTVRVFLRNAFGGGQLVNWPADHPALKKHP